MAVLSTTLPFVLVSPCAAVSKTIRGNTGT